ncbi:MAG: hypothetical protein V4616_02440 [Bacteroidota bacterium]
MRKFTFILTAVAALMACNQQQARKMPSREEIMEMNRLSAKKEGIQIQRYIDNRKWKR